MQHGNTVVLGSLVHSSSLGTTISKGANATRPASPGAATLRYNTDTGRFEGFQGSTPAWANIGLGDGTVTSVNLTSPSTGLSISGGPITSSGSISITLAGELAALNALSTTGIVTRTGSATYSPRTIAASAAAGQQGITLTNGDGVAGNPSVGLSLSGLTAAGSVATTDVLVVYNGTNNVKATVTQLAAALPGVGRTYQTSFTNASLSSGALTVTHSLNQKFVSVTIFDGNDKVIQPDDITMTSATASTVDLSSFGTLTGTWNVLVQS